MLNPNLKFSSTWYKIVLDSQLSYEILNLNQNDNITWTTSNVILINIHGLLSVIKKYTSKSSNIIYLNISNTAIFLPVNTKYNMYKLQALKPTMILVLLYSDIINNLKLLDNLKELQMRSLKQQLLFAESFMFIFMQNTIKKKLVVFLLTLSKESGMVSKLGIKINLFLSHAYLSEALGISRASITRSVNELKKNLFLLISKFLLFLILLV
uniref:Global nitrogen transcriptional regulator n=1 Tax=Rhodochaete parvula TaxID=110510 RepID=A0A220T0K0_9RHOD|nr:global nitrogen transcriptional regulator [Rhodochaete parvula]